MPPQGGFSIEVPMFNEYPKGLYMNGTEEGENVIAFDAEQEAEYRKQGYKMLNEPQEKSSKKAKS